MPQQGYVYDYRYMYINVIHFRDIRLHEIYQKVILIRGYSKLAEVNFVYHVNYNIIKVHVCREYHILIQVTGIEI